MRSRLYCRSWTPELPLSAFWMFWYQSENSKSRSYKNIKNIVDNDHHDNGGDDNDHDEVITLPSGRTEQMWISTYLIYLVQVRYWKMGVSLFMATESAILICLKASTGLLNFWYADRPLPKDCRGGKEWRRLDRKGRKSTSGFLPTLKVGAHHTSTKGSNPGRGIPTLKDCTTSMHKNGSS